MLEVVRAEIPDVRALNGEVDEGLQRILKRMTEKDPAARYQTCHELVADLARHPLLAAGNTITARPVLSTAAQTMLAMKTPLPGARAATPPPLAADDLSTRPKGQTPPPAPLPPPARPSVLEAQTRRSGTGGGALIAVAAVLLLAVLGGGAWAMRDRIPFLGGQVTASAAMPAPGAVNPPAPPAPVVATPAPPPPPAAAEPAAPALPDPVAAQHTGIAGAGAGDAPAPATDTAQSLEPLRRMAEQVRAESEREASAARTEAARVASTAPPREQAPPPRPVGPPKIAVVAFGDPAVTGPAKQAVEEALMNRGFLVVDTDALGDFARGDLPRILGGAPRHGVRAVVVVRAEPIGEQQLNYYGQSSTLYSATLTVRPYDVSSRTPLSAGVRAKVDFTSLNAEANTLEALEPQLPRVLGSLAGFKPKGQGG
jgi:serine/threonine-protein kinase